MRTDSLRGRIRGIGRRSGNGYAGIGWVCFSRSGGRRIECRRIECRRIGCGRVWRVDFLGHEQFVLMISRLHNRELFCRSQVGIFKSIGGQP